MSETNGTGGESLEDVKAKLRAQFKTKKVSRARLVERLKERERKLGRLR